MCNSVKAVSAPAPVVASQPVAGLFFAPGDKKSPAQRIAAYLRALIVAKGTKISSDTESRLYYLESYNHHDLCRKVWYITVPELADDFGFDKEFLYGIGDDGVNPPTPVKVEEKLSTGQRIVNYVQAVIAAKGLDVKKWIFDGVSYHQNLSGTYDAAINSVLNNCYDFDHDAKLLNVSVPALAKFIGVEPQYLYDIGNKKVNPPTPVKVEAKVEPTKLKTRILPGGIKRYVHVFAPALKERFDGKAKDNPLCCVRVGSNPKRFKMYRGVEFLSGASLEELAEPLAGTNGRAICVMVTTGPIRVSY